MNVLKWTIFTRAAKHLKLKKRVIEKNEEIGKSIRKVIYSNKVIFQKDSIRGKCVQQSFVVISFILFFIFVTEIKNCHS